MARVQREKMLLNLVPVADQAAALVLLDAIRGPGIELSPRELATVLFSLRLFQSECERAGGEIIDPDGFFAEEDPLSPDEIDSLCAALNGGEYD